MLSLTVGLTGALLLPGIANAQTREPLSWARVDFLRNSVQLVPQNQQSRRARISDVLSVGDALRTSRASRAELRFNDGSLARIGERATFRFTPNTRNFQLSNGTILLLIPPGRGRSTIQTPNAVTGIQGSALFVRYIPETDTTIVGALTNNPDGPMVLFNRDGTEQQALRANEIGVIQGNQITELYEFDGTLFWQSSGLAEGFNYLSDTSSAESSDPLDGVRQEIREAISNQGRINGDNVITNPEAFVNPSTDVNDNVELEETEVPVLEFEDSPAQEYLDRSAEAVDERELGIGVNNSLAPSPEEGTAKKPDAIAEPESPESDEATASGENDEPSATEPSATEPSATEPSATEPSDETGTGPTETSTETDSNTEGATDNGSSPEGSSPEGSGVQTDSDDNSGNTAPTSPPQSNTPGDSSNGPQNTPSQNGSATPNDGSSTEADVNLEAPTSSPAVPTAPTAPAAPTTPVTDGPPGDTSPGVSSLDSPTPTENINNPGTVMDGNFAPDTTAPGPSEVSTEEIPAVLEQVEQLNEVQVTNDSDMMNDTSTQTNSVPIDPSPDQDNTAPADVNDTSGDAQGAALTISGDDDNSSGAVVP